MFATVVSDSVGSTGNPASMMLFLIFAIPIFVIGGGLLVYFATRPDPNEESEPGSFNDDEPYFNPVSGDYIIDDFVVMTIVLGVEPGAKLVLSVDPHPEDRGVVLVRYQYDDRITMVNAVNTATGAVVCWNYENVPMPVGI